MSEETPSCFGELNCKHPEECVFHEACYNQALINEDYNDFREDWENLLAEGDPVE